MKKAIFAAAVVFAVCPAAFAVEVLIPNGSFEANGPGNGFGLTISNWTTTFTSTGSGPNAGLVGMQSGLFSSFAKFSVPPNGGIFATLSNIGGGTVNMTSGASGTNFLVNDRLLAFRYGYLTNDAPGGGARDEFRVRIEFFATASSTVVLSSIDQLIANSGFDTASQAGILPYAGGPNSASTVWNNTTGTNFNLVAIDISSQLGNFARVSFIVNDNGPSASSANGLGVSGIVLDQVYLTPEPGTIGLFALGALGLGGMAWRRRSAKKPVSA